MEDQQATLSEYLLDDDTLFTNDDDTTHVKDAVLAFTPYGADLLHWLLD